MRHGDLDRAFALACSLDTFGTNWIELQCCRGIQQLPVRLVPAADPRRGSPTLADFLIPAAVPGVWRAAGVGGADRQHRWSGGGTGELRSASGCPSPFTPA